ncbi:hypothetical protein [Massilia sp. GCM10023247]|uniref:hypothetical protein n=1 Tax=Massilia sp. GCM10023247 TaxID=3252643 RepID=UPI0036095C62
MRIVWSASVTMLLLLLAAMCFAVPYSSTAPVYMQLGAIALGLVFLAAAINTTGLHHAVADRLVVLLHIGAGVLVVAALIPGAASIIR